MPTARSNLGIAAVYGKIYAIGGLAVKVNDAGFINSSLCLDVNEEYDPATDNWTTKKPMPTARYDFAIAAYAGKIYCIGGLIGVSWLEATNVNEVYDPATNTWTTKAPLPLPGGEMQAHVIDNKIYLINATRTYVYDPATDNWTVKTLSSYVSFASVAFDGKIYVFGINGTNNAPFTEIYDPVTDSWNSGTAAPTHTGFGGAAATSGTIAPKQIVTFGLTTRIYDPINDKWTTAASMPSLLAQFGTVMVNDILYAIGGLNTTSYVVGIVPSDNRPVYEPVGLNQQYTPPGYGTVPPAVSVISPENNQTYNTTIVTLNFGINRDPAQVSQISYTIDQNNTSTINGNLTLTDLSSGNHTLTVTTTDTNGNKGTSQTINFTIIQPAPTPTETANNPNTNQVDTYWIAIAAVALVVAAILAAVLLTRRHKTSPK